MPVRVLFPSSLPPGLSGSSSASSSSPPSSSSSSPLVGSGLQSNSSSTSPPPLLEFNSSSSSPGGSSSSHSFQFLSSHSDAISTRKRQRSPDSEPHPEPSDASHSQAALSSDLSSTDCLPASSVSSDSVSKFARVGFSPSSASISESNSSSPDFFSLMPMRSTDEFRSFLFSQPRDASDAVAAPFSVASRPASGACESALPANRRKRRHFQSEQESSAEADFKSNTENPADVSSQYASDSSLPSAIPSVLSRKRGSNHVESSSPTAKRVQPRHRITNLHLRALHEERVRRKAAQASESAMIQSPLSKLAPAPTGSPAVGPLARSRFNLLSPAVKPRASPFFSQVHLEEFDQSQSSWAGVQPEWRSIPDTQMGFSMTSAGTGAEQPNEVASLQPDASPSATSQSTTDSQSTLGPFSLSLRSSSRSLSNGSAMFD